MTYAGTLYAEALYAGGMWTATKVGASSITTATTLSILGMSANQGGPRTGMRVAAYP